MRHFQIIGIRFELNCLRASAIKSDVIVVYCALQPLIVHCSNQNVLLLLVLPFIEHDRKREFINIYFRLVDLSVAFVRFHTQIKYNKMHIIGPLILYIEQCVHVRN